MSWTDLPVKKIREAQAAWASGRAHGEIVKECGLTSEQEFAINVCSEGLTEWQIARRLPWMRIGMKAKEIMKVMQGE